MSNDEISAEAATRLDRRRFLGMGAMAAGAAALAIARPAFAAPACTVVAPPSGGYLNRPYLNIRDFGAKGDGSCWDTDAINSAIQAVISGLTSGSKLDTIFFPPGYYHIGEAITIDLTGVNLAPGNKVGLKFLGNHARIALSHKSCADGVLSSCAMGSYAAFNIIAGPENDLPNNTETEFIFDNLIFEFESRTMAGTWKTHEDTIRPHAIYTQGACRVSVINCRFNNINSAIKIFGGRNHLVSGCQFDSCHTAVHLFSCRDSVVIASMATNSVIGYRFEGEMSPNKDGGNKILDSMVITSSEYGILMIGQYTPVLSGITTESCAIANIRIETSQFGMMSDVYTGSTIGYALIFGRMPNRTWMNAGWTISNVTCPLPKVKFEYLGNSSIHGFAMVLCPPDNYGPKAIEFLDCAHVEINAIIRNLPSATSYSMFFSGCGAITLNGGVYQKTIGFENDSGEHLFNGPKLSDDVEWSPTQSEATRLKTSGRYYLLRSGDSEQREKQIRFGRVLPVLVDSKSVTGGNWLLWDPRLTDAINPSIMPNPTNGERAVRAKFQIFAGASTYGGAIVEFIYTSLGFSSSIITKIPGDLDFSISDSGANKGKIGVDNNSGSTAHLQFYLIELDYFRVSVTA